MPARRQGVGQAAPWLLLAVVLGCRAPGAPLAGCHPGSSSRPATLARQLAADTALETIRHPAQSTATVLAAPPTLLHAMGQQLVVKQLAVCRAAHTVDEPGTNEPLDPVALEAELRKVTRTGLEPAAVCLQPDGATAFAALWDVIESAEHQIDVLMFLWESDAVGERVVDHLAARAAQGVRVRVLVDGGGNLVHAEAGNTTQEVNRAVCRLARSPGVELLRTRNPFGRFDHRKLVIADGKNVWSGGRNFTWRGFFGQRDVSFTLTGSLAGKLAAMFEAFWREQGGKPGPALPCPPPADPDAMARIVETSPNCRSLAHSLHRALEHARHHVYLENLFVSDPWVVTKLVRARRRGADVRVLLTNEGDSKVMNRASRLTANRLLAAGVRVYMHPGMLHTKSAAVDGRWAYVGTGNFDALSLRQDREVGLAVGDGPLLGRVEEVLQSGHRPEWELTEPLPVEAGDYFAALVAGLFL